MKIEKIIILLLGIISIQCKAQSPVIDLQAWRGQIIPNMYLKDVNNILNPFEGTWVYTNGTTSLKIVLVKKTMTDYPDYYEDLIIGEYQYIENGVEKFNSLSNLNAVLTNNSYHKINGNFIPHSPSPFNEVTAGEVRLQIIFKDNAVADLDIRRKMIGNQQAIQILVSAGEQPATLVGTPIITPIFPRDIIYTLIKQP